MATLLESVHVARPTRWRRHGALSLADAAASGCLRTAGVAPGEVDLVINTGIYRDRNLAEPAMAALIQEDLGINPEDPHVGGHGSFSFDLANGTCGPLSALEVAAGFLRAGTIRRALVVTSDADPGHGLAEDFPFAPVGAALTCTWSDDDRGLGPVRWSADTAGDPSLRAVVEPVQRGNRLRVDVDPRYLVHAATVAAEAAGKALAEAGLQPRDVAITVAAPGGGAFLSALCRQSGIPTDRVVAAAPEVHTAALVVAVDTAGRAGWLRPDQPVLLVAAAAGVVAGAALYWPVDAPVRQE